MINFNSFKNYSALIIICICFLFSPDNAFSNTENRIAEPDAKEFTGEISNKYPSLDDSHALTSYRNTTGFRYMVPFSSALIEKGKMAMKEGNDKKAAKFFKDAIAMSPDMPQAYIYMAKASFSFDGITSSVGYLFKSWDALTKNVWWSFRTAGMFMSSLYLSLYMSVTALFLIFICSRFRLYIHDVMENAKKIFLLVPAIVLLFFGPIFSLFGLIIPFWTYLNEKERGLVYGIFIAVFAVLITLPFHAIFLNAYSNQNLRDIVNVNSGLYTGDKSYTLEGHDDYESVFTLALSKKKMGNYQEAINLYKTILGQRKDAIIYNNIANCYVGLADFKTATTYYNKSLNISDLASAYYNLSQLNREVFNFRDAEKYYSDAVQINADKVSGFVSLRGDSAGSSVVDEVFGVNELWSLILNRSMSDASLGLMGRLYSYTNRGVSVILILILAVFLTVYGMMVQGSAYSCSKCGRIYCGSCEDKSVVDDICLVCHRTLSEKSLVKPRDRTARTVAIHRYSDSRTRIFNIISFLVPGGGHIFQRKTFSGYMIMFMFFLFLVSGFLWTFFMPSESMAVVASTVKLLSFVGLVLIYSIVIVSIIREGV